MRKIREIQEEGFYILQGRAAAGSVFIEDLAEAKKFLELVNKRLHGFLKVRDFLLTKNSWTLLCEVGTRKEILASYARQFNANEKGKLMDVWRIISEQIRHILSIFVKYTNWKQGRTGGKVHSNYERFIFETEIEAEGFIKKMKNQILNHEPKLKRYRSKKGLYGISKKLGVGHVYLCTKSVVGGELEGLFKIGSLGIVKLSKDVLRKLIDHTFNQHFPEKNEYSKNNSD